MADVLMLAGVMVAIPSLAYGVSKTLDRILPWK